MSAAIDAYNNGKSQLDDLVERLKNTLKTLEEAPATGANTTTDAKLDQITKYVQDLDDRVAGKISKLSDRLDTLNDTLHGLIQQIVPREEAAETQDRTEAAKRKKH